MSANNEKTPSSQEFRDMEAHLRRIESLAKVGFWEFDLKSGEVIASEQAREIYGLGSRTLTIAEVQKQVLPEYRETLDEALKNLIENKVSYEVEFGIRHPGDGTIRHIHSVAEYDTERNRVLGTLQDRTEREEILAKYRHEHKILTRAESIAYVGSWEWESESDTVYWSEELFRIFGLPVSETAPPFAQHQSYYIKRDWEKLLAAVEKCLKEHVPYSLELRIERPDGERRVCLTQGQVQQDALGKVIGLAGSVHDITERKKAEAALRKSEERFRLLLDEVESVSVQGYAPDGTVLYWNRSSTLIYGYTAEEALGGNLLELIIPPEMREGVKEALEYMIATGRGVPAEELSLMRKDGSRVSVFSSHCVVERLNGERELFCIDVDLTPAKEVEQEREKLQEQLAQSQKMESVGRLAGGIAHDFNNMLNVILGHAELLRDDLPQGSPLRADLLQIQKSAQRSADLTRQLLAFARKQTVAPKVLDLNETVGSMLKMLGRLIGEDIDLLWKPGHGIEKVLMDPAQVDQLLANLCVNARDAIGKHHGKVTIQTQAVSFDEEYCADHADFKPGDYVMLAVSDDGCGMDAETREHIFEPFYTTKGVGEGTGLGLSTVYGIINQNNAFLNVYSEPGHGSSFRIYLPVYRTDAQTAPEEQDQEESAQGTETVLVVEDEPAILGMTARFLERQGYQVLTAETPGAAMKLARSHPGTIDLLVSDVIMPEVNGRDLAREMLKVYPAMERLFMSGYTADVIAHQGVLEAGVNFIQKPFSKRALTKKVRQVLDRRS